MCKNALKNSDLAWSRRNDYRLLQLANDTEERVNENKVADALIKDIKGFHIRIITFSY
jgi:hypothetical protein